jgi:hypothetical protein
MPDLTGCTASVTGDVRAVVAHSATRNGRRTMDGAAHGTDTGAVGRTVDAAERTAGAR